ncbi:MAG TPA: MFS transporter, partial [Pirellulales bacterium]|nr:MFS transporter [Pirellulales bacterium]
MIRSLPRSLYPTYGWVIVVVAALAMVATLPGRTHGLGMVTERLLADEAFGDLDAGMLDGSEGGTLEERQKRRREAYSDMNLWGTLLGALFCLPCGRLIDRFGLRITLTTTVVALAAVVIGMTYLSGKWPLFAAILLTRGFGQSALSVISITMVGKWYRGRLGPPMAVYSLLLSFGFVGAARCAKPFALDDWRVVWGGMGWMLLLGMVPIAWLFTRDPSARDRDDLEQPLPVEMGYTLAQAIRTPAFWVFGLAISVVAVNTSGQSLFSESILTQQGFRVDAYYDLMILSGSIGLLAQLPVGWLLRFFPLGRMQAVGLFLMGACLFWLPSIHAQWQLTTYAVVMGLAGTTMTL